MHQLDVHNQHLSINNGCDDEEAVVYKQASAHKTMPIYSFYFKLPKLQNNNMISTSSTK